MNATLIPSRKKAAPQNAMIVNRGAQEAIEGDLVGPVLVTSAEMSRLNEAREVFNELRSILLAQIVPSLDGGWSNPMATQLESRLEAITFATGNFLWKRRHAGAAHDAVNVEAAR